MSDSQSLSHALNLAYFYLKFRPRTESELLRYLKRKKNSLSENVIQSALSTLKQQGYIDDDAFIGLFVSERGKLKPKSTRILSHELQQKGVSKELINNYFSTHPIDEETAAQNALSKKINNLKIMLPKERYKKTISFLLYRGFTYEIAKKTYYFFFSSS